MIVRSSDGKIIGDIENGVFIKRVYGSSHMLKTPPAWAIDCKAFLDSVIPHAHRIRVEDKDTGVAYEIATGVFSDHKVYVDRGFGAQYFVPLKYWHEIHKEQPSLL